MTRSNRHSPTLLRYSNSTTRWQIRRDIMSMLLCCGALCLAAWLAFPASAAPQKAKKRPRPKTHHDDFVWEIKSIAAQLRRITPKTWDIELGDSQLHTIHWQAGPQMGHMIRFIHRSRKVPIPNTQSLLRPGKGNTRSVLHRCSLHFYPRWGRYRAHQNRLMPFPPARFVGVHPNAMVLQPARYVGDEYPCPELFKTLMPVLGLQQKPYTLTVPVWLKKYRVTRAQLFSHHINVRGHSAKAGLPWLKMLQKHKRGTLKHQRIDAYGTHTEVYNKRLAPPPVPR